MPWEHCGRSVLDDEACPECGASKTAWTVDFQVTREFRVRCGATALRFEVLAPGGEPVADEPFRVELADGGVVEGALDALGAARVTPSGGDACVIELPERQAGEVLPVAEEGEAAPARPRGPGRARFERPAAARKHRFELAPEVRLVVPASAFADGFPAPGVLGFLRAAAAALTERPGSALRVVGVEGEAGRRRAEALLALLRGDAAAFGAQVGAADGPALWFQSMLHAIGCNPGAADDAPGAFTRESLRCFQREYAEGLFHADGIARAVEALGEGGELDADTRRAIVDAYVQAAPRVDAARLTSGEPTAAEALGEASAGEPAVALLVWRPDAGVDPGAALGRAFEPTVPWLFDPRWRQQAEDGRVQLSALTPLPDGSACRFRIERLGDAPAPASPPESSRGEALVALGAPIAELEGVVRGGVAWAKWTRGDEVEDPFHRLGLFAAGPPAAPIEVDEDIARTELDLPEDVDDEERALFELHWKRQADAPAATPTAPEEVDRGPLVFLVEAGERWAYSHPPGVPLERLRFGDDDATGVAVRHDGRPVKFTVAGGRVQGEVREAFVTAVVSLVRPEEARA